MFGANTKLEEKHPKSFSCMTSTKKLTNPHQQSD